MNGTTREENRKRLNSPITEDLNLYHFYSFFLSFLLFICSSGKNGFGFITASGIGTLQYSSYTHNKNINYNYSPEKKEKQKQERIDKEKKNKTHDCLKIS